MTHAAVAPATSRHPRRAAPPAARLARAAVLAALAAALVPAACAKKPPPADASGAPGEVASGAPGADASGAPPPAAASAPSRPPGPEPPSGQWAVKADVVADTCSVKHGAPPPTTVPLISKLSKGKTHLSLSMPAPVVGNAPAKAAPIMKQDVQGEVGHSFRDTLPPRDLDCPSYEVSYTLKVLEVSRERIRVSKLEEYGDGKKCAKKPDFSSCKVELSYTYTLARAECEAACNVSMASAAPGAASAPMRCDCS
ncbi:MAG TPA: hypothetical protein VFS43_28580 [Polyangiaceae bacterium]|nr:hypothetical protein [Polyangiaceae bacterium]